MDKVELLHRTVDAAYVRDLELQVKQMQELVQCKINADVIDAVYRHMKEHNRSRVLALYTILEATSRTLSSMEITSENVNRVATAIQKSMNMLNQEKS